MRPRGGIHPWCLAQSGSSNHQRLIALFGEADASRVQLPLGVFQIPKIHRPLDAVARRKRDNVERLVGVKLASMIQRFAAGKMRLNVIVFRRDSAFPIGSMDGNRFFVRRARTS